MTVNDAVTNVVRALRDEPRLVALVGSWSIGDAFISWNPAREATGDFLDYEIVEGGEFKGGWIGSWGYDGTNVVGWYDFGLVLRNGEWHFVTNANDERVEAIRAAMTKATAITSATALSYTTTPFEIVPNVETHKANVARTRDYIIAGDIFQANMCLRFEASFFGDPVDLFCEGLKVAPAYGALIKNHDKAIVSLSPELFLSRNNRQILTSPIKGTVPLSMGAEDLHESAKDRAENTMIVDLMRNDFSKVCKPGSVQVPHHLRVERHSVWHLVSDVTGELEPTANDHDLMQATFPPGSITGAPKERAMEIIAELEPSPRHAYTGVIGYAAPEALELNVAIRTFEIDKNRIWLGAGGGIVVDSDPLAEVRECFVKAEPLISAIGGQMPSPPQLPDRPNEELAFERIEGSPVKSAGIYESTLVVDGEIQDLELHKERMRTSADELGLSVGDVWERASDAARDLAGIHRLRVDVATESCFEISEVLLDDKPWTLEPRMVAGGWGQHKWADRSAIADGEYLFIDENDDLLETSRAALGVVFDDGVHFPILDKRILQSVARQHVIEKLTQQKIAVFERNINFSELKKANEVFAMNAIRGIKPVVAVTGVGEWQIGPMAKWLQTQTPDPEKKELPIAAGAKVLVIDNHDSFVYNLARYVRELGGQAIVVKNDEISVEQIEKMVASSQITHIIISPGPMTPTESGVSVAVIERLAEKVPILGVCLGHQCIAQALGGRVVLNPKPTHGKAAIVWHDEAGVFRDIAGPIMAGRYHSLIVADLPDEFFVTARTGDGTIMGIRHLDYQLEGLQVHPESLLTPLGHSLIANFLTNKDR